MLASLLALLQLTGVALAGFQPQQTFPTGSNPISVATADLNGDGKPDLAVANISNNNIGVLLANGDGTFQGQQTFSAGTSPTSLTIADLNGDGKPDLAVANFNSSNVSVLLGNGNGTFQGQQTFSAGASPTFVAIADLNGDGKPDLAVANFNSANVSVLMGNGNGAFQGQLTLPAGTNPASVAIADLNGDGKPDLAVANQRDNNIGVLLGNGDGAFQAQQTVPVGTLPTSVAIADFNGDGKPDLAVANFNSANVSVLLGNGNGAFQGQQTLSVGVSPTRVTIADLNGDGKPDLAVTSQIDNNVGVLLGNPSGALQFSSPNVTVAEGGGATTLTLTRSGSTDGQVSALIGLTGGTATQGADLTFTSPQTVTWNDGDGAPKTISIPIIQDQVDEGDETAQFTIALPGNRFGATLGTHSTHAITIIDDDPLHLDIEGVTVAEGNSGTSNAVFTVTRVGPTVRTASVQFATGDGAAKAGSDYTATSGTLTLAPNESTKTISVPILGDTLVEPDEAFTVTLSNPTNATLGVSQAFGLIQNDDLATSCGPRPRVTQSLTAAGGALAVHIEASPLNSSSNNPLRQIKFGTFQNATVTLNGQTVSSGQTVILPANAFGADLSVRRVTAGQATTVAFTVSDSCGAWDSFVGGGAGAGF